MRHKNTDRWELEYKPETGGHAYFWDFKSGSYLDWRYHVAVADQSGSNPEETDDGVLYLDKSRPIVAGEAGYVTGYGECYHIPLFYPDGRRSRTVATRREALGVADRFKMEIQTQD